MFINTHSVTFINALIRFIDILCVYFRSIGMIIISVEYIMFIEVSEEQKE